MSGGIGAGRLTNAFASVTSGLSSVITSGKLPKNGDGKLFNSSKRSEVADLKSMLNAPAREKKKSAVKKVIASMTQGRDVSSLFPEMVNCMQTTNLELKKLVYLYVINFARTRPDLAILAVNTFRKDTMDASPLVRALAIRTMGCIRLKQMVEYLVEPLKRLCKDSDPYVRKTAAICVGKLYETSPKAAEEHEFIDMLKSMLSDGNPMVVVNVVATLDEISSVSETDHLDFNSETIAKLMVALPDCSEWGQVILLDAIAKWYKPSSEREAEQIIDRLTSRLNHANPGVILSCTRLLIKLVQMTKNQALSQDTLTKRIVPPLLSLLSTDVPELQFVVLRNLQVIVQRFPHLLNNECRMFFVKFNDPCYVKFEKVDLLVRCATPANLELIMEELTEYAQEVDVEFVKRSLRGIGRVAMRVDGAVERALRSLVSLAESRTPFIIEEVIVVVRDIFRKFPNRYDSVLSTLLPLADKVEATEAKGAVVWMAGEYAERIPSAEKILSKHVDTFTDEALEVQLQILTAVMKLYLKFPSVAKEMVFRVLQLATEEVDCPDLRDRAFIYWRMLTSDAQLAKKVICGPRPPINISTTDLSAPLLNRLVSEIGLMSSVYHKPLGAFLSLGNASHNRRDDDSANSDDGDSSRRVQPTEIAARMAENAQRRPYHSSSSGGEEEEDDDDADGRHERRRRASSSSSSASSDESAPYSHGEDAKPVAAGGNRLSAGTGSGPAAAAPTRPIPPRIVFLPHENGRGLQVEGCVTRMKGSAVLLMRLSNHGSVPLNQFRIELAPNSFGFGTTTPPLLQGLTLQPGAHANISSPLAAGENVSSQPPSTPPTLMARLSCQPIGDLALTIPYELINVFVERPAVSKDVFKEHWTRIGEARQLRFLGSLNSGEPGVVEEIGRKLAMYNIQLVTSTPTTGRTSLYLSAVTTNNLLILFEVVLQGSAPGICIGIRTDAAILLNPIAQNVCRLLGVTPNKK